MALLVPLLVHGVSGAVRYALSPFVVSPRQSSSYTPIVRRTFTRPMDAAIDAAVRQHQAALGQAA